MVCRVFDITFLSIFAFWTFLWTFKNVHFSNLSHFFFQKTGFFNLKHYVGKNKF